LSPSIFHKIIDLPQHVTALVPQTSSTVGATATDQAGHTGDPAQEQYPDTAAPETPSVTVAGNPDGTLTATSHSEAGTQVTVHYATVAIAGISEDPGLSGSDFVTAGNTLLISVTVAGELIDGDRVRRCRWTAARRGMTPRQRAAARTCTTIRARQWPTARTRMRQACDGTAWTFDNTANTMADGTYDVIARIVDTAGYVGQSASQQVMIDTMPPSDVSTITSDGISDDNGASTSDFSPTTTRCSTTARRTRNAGIVNRQ